MTQKEQAQRGIISQQISMAAEREGVSPELIIEGLARGEIVIPSNIGHKHLVPCAIGKGLRTKVNANIGTSPDLNDMDIELEKLRIAIEYKADAVMDLSTGGDIPKIRRVLLARCPLPLGTVPIYQTAVEALERYGAIVAMSADDIFNTILQHAQDGVDFITVHCGVNLSSIERLRGSGRVTDVVSRGGSFLIGWMIYHQRENPLYEHFDRLLEIARQYDLTLSLGDGLRPGSIADATDKPQIGELLTIAELVERAREGGVQVIVEGPGHLPLDQIKINVHLAKSLTKGAPFYVLGPLVTDISCGYDHISAAIGGAIAAAYGADFLCYVTPAEHLGLPTPQDVKEGIIAARIAAHAADIVKGVKGAWEWDLEMSKARKKLDWERQISLSLDKEKAREIHNRYSKGRACSMCGQYCAMMLTEKYLGISAERCR